MYFPYLRGKQFELIALRELSGFMSRHKEKISPLIEPVKSSSTLVSTIKELLKNDVNFNIVVNPSVGDLKNKTSQILDLLKNGIINTNNFQIAIIVDDKVDIDIVISEIEKTEISFSGLTLIHNSVVENISELIKAIPYNVVFNLINFSKTSRRYYREFNRNTIVELDDYFNIQQRNSNYLEISDSPFTEEHLYYKEDGFIGFSDFLTIGEPYSESGFLPYAVAIHLSYVDKSNKIRIKHFVSDSNDDTSDVAGKFAEALNKLINWANEMNIHTQAMEEFRLLYENKHFPGLGSIKKLSIMHHIELILSLI